jgi:NAD(P)-dependent dehydrogenase (short-subunit alcohol dehydrogenase family)
MGLAMAMKFAEHGCKKLFLVDISEKGLQKTEALVQQGGSGSQVATHISDIRVEAEVEETVKTCVETYGRIDFAMNNDGVGEGGVKTADMSVEMFDRVCDTNEKGVSNRGLIPTKATYFEVF